MTPRQLLRSVRSLIARPVEDPDASEARQLVAHRRHARAGDYSFAGEAALVETLLEQLEVRQGYAADIAASDGVSQSCTVGLYRKGWRGLAVEFDPEKFSKLAYAYEEFDVVLTRCKVTPSNVASVLRAAEVPSDFDFLNLDIDSYDLAVIEGVLSAGFRPKLISMEINEKIPPPLYFTVLFADDHVWKGDHFYGCSAVAADQTVSRYGYLLQSIQANNAVFIKRDLAAAHGMVGKDVTEAYRCGYRDRAGRAEQFPWNRNVDAALDMTPEEAFAFFTQFFAPYRGRYELRIASQGETALQS